MFTFNFELKFKKIAVQTYIDRKTFFFLYLTSKEKNIFFVATTRIHDVLKVFDLKNISSSFVRLLTKN